MPTLAIQPATAPVDAPFPPASAQAMLNFVAAYLQVSGLENLTGVIVGKDTPSANDRDKGWVKLDPASNRALGLYVFNGSWVPLPLVVPSGSAPTSPRTGELRLNELKGVEIYDGSKWTTNLFPSGATAERPKSPATNDLFFDTDISRLLRSTTQGWTTFDGAVGDIKMVDAFDVQDALTKNPGWSEFTAMAGKFVMGSSATYGPTTEGGRDSIAWSAKGTSAQGGNRESPAIGAISIDGTEVAGKANLNNTPAALDSGTFKILPPYKAMIFLRKDY